MNTIKTTGKVIHEALRNRSYASSIMRVARHFHYVKSGARVLALADALQAQPDIAAVGVVDDDGQSVGFVRRDQLFALVGKPFGRDILQRAVVAEVTETATAINAHTDVFAAAATITGKSSDDDAKRRPYHPIVDEVDGFLGLVAAQDLSDYLARITQDDIELAGRLQERLLAGNDLRSRPGLRLAAWSRAAKGIGGDFYFVRELPDGRTFAALCDVSGKGVAASLIVSLVWGMLRGYDFRRGLRRLIIDLNEAIVATFHLEKYLTGFFIIHDPAKPYLLCADMGHSHAFFCRRDRIMTFHGHEHNRHLNLPIGVEQHLEPILMSIRVESGDTVFCYSDGLSEQENPANEEFGERRLARVLRTAIGDGAFARRISSAIDDFRAGTPQQDDMSLLALTIETVSPH